MKKTGASTLACLAVLGFVLLSLPCMVASEVCAAGRNAGTPCGAGVDHLHDVRSSSFPQHVHTKNDGPSHQHSQTVHIPIVKDSQDNQTTTSKQTVRTATVAEVHTDNAGVNTRNHHPQAKRAHVHTTSAKAPQTIRLPAWAWGVGGLALGSVATAIFAAATAPPPVPHTPLDDLAYLMSFQRPLPKRGPTFEELAPPTPIASPNSRSWSGALRERSAV